MDRNLRLAERCWAENPTKENWIHLLRISEMAGQPRFTIEGLATAVYASDVSNWESLPSGFQAYVRDASYPYRLVDDSNWEGWVEVNWREEDEDPELRIQIVETWNAGPVYVGGRWVTEIYRYWGFPVTNDAELIRAMSRPGTWEYIGTN